MGAARADGTARESGFHCMSPVVASRLFAPVALATPPLTRRPAPGVFACRNRARELYCGELSYWNG
jgi:hypothetical protein